MQQSDARRRKADWLVPSGLVALSLVPVLAGGVRISQLIGGAPGSADDARFFDSPAPVMIHVVVVSLYCVLGAFQFAPGFRRRNPRWHRTAGKILVPCGLAAALTGLWMTQFYTRISSDSVALYTMRLAVGAAMAAAIVMAVSAIRSGTFGRTGPG